MRFSQASLLVAASGALALTQHDCLVDNSADLAEFLECGSQALAQTCLSKLSPENSNVVDIEACFISAGCPSEAAAIEARSTVSRCEELILVGDLRRRYGAIVDRADPTTGDTADAPKSTGNIRTGTAECMTTSTVKVKTCPVETANGHITTKPCSSVDQAQSECSPGFTCTIDGGTGSTLCMQLQNELNTSGIVIAIVFAAAIAIGLGTLTFLCCKDRREQKRLTAKAEATALARAATRKQRQRDVRQPLMSQQPAAGGAAAPADPFADRGGQS